MNAARRRANTKDEDPTGLLNEGHRYRDLAAGVFISRDPAGFVDGPNVYTYVRQNPWSHYDPVGLFIAAIAEKLGERFGSNPIVEAMAPHTEVVVNTTQNTLAVASMVPALGKVADGLSAGISAADGKYGEAAATAGGGSAGKLLAKGVKALKQAGAAVVVVTGVVEETAKHGDEITTTAKSAREIVEQAAKQADEAAPLAKGPVTAGEHTTLQEFADRSVVGDGLEGHELWQHANMNEHGLTATRLSTPASQKNPVIALDKATHKKVNTAQRVLEARAMDPVDNIRANADIMRQLKAANTSTIDAAERAALNHARDYGY